MIRKSLVNSLIYHAHTAWFQNLAPTTEWAWACGLTLMSLFPLLWNSGNIDLCLIELLERLIESLCPIIINKNYQYCSLLWGRFRMSDCFTFFPPMGCVYVSSPWIGRYGRRATAPAFRNWQLPLPVSSNRCPVRSLFWDHHAGGPHGETQQSLPAAPISAPGMWVGELSWKWGCQP